VRHVFQEEQALLRILGRSATILSVAVCDYRLLIDHC
jgi:hypothetical protein